MKRVAADSNVDSAGTKKQRADDDDPCKDSGDDDDDYDSNENESLCSQQEDDLDQYEEELTSPVIAAAPARKDLDHSNIGNATNANTWLLCVYTLWDTRSSSIISSTNIYGR